MKKVPLLFFLVLSLSACQHPAAPVAAVAGEPSLGAVPTKAAMPAKQKVASFDSLNPEMRTLLREHDLAPLWANQTEIMKTHPAMEGFYGPDYYRISFYFSEVKRDSARLNVFHVKGLDRYKKAITPFVGIITVQSVQPFSKGMVVDADSSARAFTAMGRFELNEDPTTQGAGNYSGKALLDFYIDGNGRIEQVFHIFGQENPTKGCGLLFSGSQVSNQTGTRKSVAFANFYGAVVPKSLEKFGLGDRSEGVNPHLAKYGWDESWKNDEWWAKAAKPSLSL